MSPLAQASALDRSVLRPPVTVIVPCCNEEPALPNLARALEQFRRRAQADWDIRFIFIDDGSTDETWALLCLIFGDRPDCRIIRQRQNRGIAATCQSGIRFARTEIVAVIDCDCTYAPEQLLDMLPLLGEDVACVTASPYHADGEVRNVARWRLVLSRGLSVLYRRVLTQKLATYTSCFRVYRRSAVLDIGPIDPGFTGIAQILARLDRRGRRIIEAPAVLEARTLGQSKLRIGRAVMGHLRLLLAIAADRVARIPQSPKGRRRHA